MIPLSEHPRHVAAQADIDRLAAARSKIETRLAELDLLVARQAPMDRPSQHVAAALQFAETGIAVNSAAMIGSLNDERQALLPQRDALTLLIGRRLEDPYVIRPELSRELLDLGAVKLYQHSAT